MDGIKFKIKPYRLYIFVILHQVPVHTVGILTLRVKVSSRSEIWKNYGHNALQ
jgi:hypothetical protein